MSCLDDKWTAFKASYDALRATLDAALENTNPAPTLSERIALRAQFLEDVEALADQLADDIAACNEAANLADSGNQGEGGGDG